MEHTIKVSAKKSAPPYAGMLPAFGGSAVWHDQVVVVEARTRKEARKKAIAKAKKSELKPSLGYYKWLASL